MTAWFSMRRARRVLLALGIGTASLWLVGTSQFDRLLAWKWRCQIDAADDREAIAQVGRIASLGEAGMPELVGLLGSQRLCVVEAVRQALNEQMLQWSDLDPLTCDHRKLVLAHALADQIAKFSPDARCVASDFALRILGATHGNEASDAEIIFACDQVLRASALERRGRLLARRATAVLGGENKESAQYEQNRAPRLASLPGGNLLPGGVESPALSAEEPEEQPGRAIDEDPRAMASNEPARLPDSGASRIAPDGETDTELAEAAATIEHNAKVDNSDATEEDASREAAAELRWMFALRSADPNRRQRAEEELRAIGFEALQLELARQLTDPDPKVRRELAESLPSMPGIDARTWLVWLSRDRTADVRLAAMTVMATMGDPNTLRRIEQMARTDADPRIQRQGEQLLKVLQADSRPNGGPERRLTR
jgi:HEAT repeats